MRNSMIVIVAAAFFALGFAQAQAADVEGDEARELAFSLCYAQHAYGNCMSLGIGMRLDTRAKVELEFCILPSTRSRLSQDSLNL